MGSLVLPDQILDADDTEASVLPASLDRRVIAIGAKKR